MIGHEQLVTGRILSRTEPCCHQQPHMNRLLRMLIETRLPFASMALLVLVVIALLSPRMSYLDAGFRYMPDLHAAQARRIGEDVREYAVELAVVVRLHIDHEGVVWHAQEAREGQVVRAEHRHGYAALENCAVHTHRVLRLPRRAHAEHRLRHVRLGFLASPQCCEVQV